MTDQVLDQNTEQHAEQPSAEQAQPTNVFEQLVGEDKKYRTDNDLANAKLHADEHISKLERENAEMREELAKKVGAEEVLAQLREQQAPTQTENTPPSVDVESLVREALAADRQKAIVEANRNEANQALNSVYGSKSVEAVATRATELGMTNESLLKMAEQSPAAFKSLMGLSGTQRTETTPAPAGQGQRTEGMATHEEDWNAYYTKMRREDRKRYFSVQEQNKRHELAMQGKYITNK